MILFEADMLPYFMLFTFCLLLWKDVHEVIKGQMFPTSKILSRKANASELALFALKSFQPFLLDISIVYRVLDTLLSYLDKGLKWQYPAVVNVSQMKFEAY